MRVWSEFDFVRCMEEIGVLCRSILQTFAVILAAINVGLDVLIHLLNTIQGLSMVDKRRYL